MSVLIFDNNYDRMIIRKNINPILCFCPTGGKTALMIGAYNGHVHIVSLLMELGCNWRKLDNTGCSGEQIMCVYMSVRLVLAKRKEIFYFPNIGRPTWLTYFVHIVPGNVQ